MIEAVERPSAKTLVFACASNDQHRIEAFCREILATDRECHLLIVDDGSCDETAELLERCLYETTRLAVIRRPFPLGIGSAHLLAMRYAVSRGYDELVTVGNIDESTKPISALRNELDRFDCVQLPVDGHASQGAGMMALFAPLVGLPFGQGIGGTRAYRVAALRDLDHAELPAEELSFLVEVTRRLHRGGARVGISSSERTTPRAAKPSEAARAMWRALSGAFRHGKRRKAHAIETRCYACSSDWVVEKYRRSGEVSQDVRAYQCTSMDHTSKPQVLACLECGLQYVQESEMPHELEEMYADVVDENYLANLPARYRTFREVYRKIEPLLPRRRDAAAPKMLELGCYAGAFMEIAQENGWQTQGIEPSRWASGYARERGLDVHCGTLDDFPANGERYDAIVMWDVLEHVKDPIGLLRQASDLLTDDGVIFLSTLDVDNWFPRMTGKAWPWLMSMHIFYYTASGLADLYRRAGLRMDHVQSYCHYISVRYFVQKIATLLPPALRPLVTWLGPITPRSLFIPFHFGDIKLYTGSKLPTAVPVPTKTHVPTPAEVVEIA